MTPEDRTFLWDHFKFNADQRLKAFNFFVVFSVFANGGVFAATEKGLKGPVFVLIGGFIAILSIVFWLIDTRCEALIQIAVPGLKQYESNVPAEAQLFRMDALRRPRFARFKYAFRILFVLQLLFGAGTVGYGALRHFA